VPNPKYKTSHSKTRRRRANIRLTEPNVVPCPHCKEPKVPHRVCTSCGKYDDRQVFALEAAEQ
jgi:large subunit ribosomal protein L32